MRLLTPIATALLVLSCGACKGDGVAPTDDPVKRAEVGRLRTIADAFRLITIELSEIGRGRDIDEVDSFAATLDYTVRLNNPTANEHLVMYQVYWQGRSFTPVADICHPGAFERGDWTDQLPGSKILQPFESITVPNSYRPFASCFDFDLTSSGAYMTEIDGFGSWTSVEQTLAKLEGRPPLLPD